MTLQRESGERPRQPEGHAPAHTADSSTLLPRLFCHNPTLQHCRLPNVTKRRSKRIFVRTSYPRGHEGAPRCGGGDSRILTNLSIDGEYSSNTLSERRGWLLRAYATPSNGEVLQERHKGFSRLVFDLLPNPSIDHLVSVILKYPRREESGRRKSLNPGPIG